MSFYRIPTYTKSQISSVPHFEGETIEDKIERIVNNGDPIDATAQIIHTDKSKGVQPQYNIRTDRWEQATEIMDVVHRGKLGDSTKGAKDAGELADKVSKRSDAVKGEDDKASDA